MEQKQKETETYDFTERAVMSLVTEVAELKETAARITAVLAALALTYGISTKV